MKGGCEAILSHASHATSQDRSRARARAHARTHARQTHTKVIGTHEVDAIIRCHTTPRETWTLVALDIATMNPVFAPFFVWSHEAIVYNRSDKAFILCVHAHLRPSLLLFRVG